MYVYLIIQTRNVPSTDYVVAVCKTKELAERWVIYNCHHYGDCVSSLTKQFIKPPSYKEYASGEWLYYRYPKKPALLIQPYKFIEDNSDIDTKLNLF